jgi:Holliday junction resolvase RusA-like endonuclease
MIYTLSGAVPSKKNSKRIVRAGKRVLIIPSKNHYLWHKEALKDLLSQGIEQIDKCTIDIRFIFGDMRRADLSNKAESIMDLLVDAGIIKDDNWQVVNDLHLSGAYSKGVFSTIIKIRGMND